MLIMSRLSYPAFNANLRRGLHLVLHDAACRPRPGPCRRGLIICIRGTAVIFTVSIDITVAIAIALGRRWRRRGWRGRNGFLSFRRGAITITITILIVLRGCSIVVSLAL